MIIGIDATRANRPQKTGVEWYAWHIIQELKKIIPDSDRVILYSEVPLKGELAVLPKNWQNKVLSWPPKLLWTQIRLSLEMLYNSPDVLFVPAHVFPFIRPTKTVMTVHDVAAAKFPEAYGWFERWYTLWSSKVAALKLWKIITPSEFTKQELLSLVKKNSEKIKNKIEVIYHGFDKDFKNIVDDVILHKYKITKPFFLFTGRIEEKKNVLNLIKAFECVKNNRLFSKHQLVLLGKNGYGAEKIISSIQSSPFKKDIILTGWCNKEDYIKILSSAEIFVFASKYEGFGMPILEAFAVGIPVIISKGNALEEVSSESAYLCENTPSSIAKAITEVSKNESLKKWLTEKGYERSLDFSWGRSALLTWKTIKS